MGQDGKFGYLINGSYDRNNRSIDDVEWGWNVDDNGRSYPVEWDQRDYLYGRVRYGAGGDLDYRMANGGTVFLKGMWSQFDNDGIRYRFDVSGDGDSTQAATATGGIATGATFVREVQNRQPHEQMYGLTTGGNSPMGPLTADYRLDYSGTQQTTLNHRTHDFEWDGPDRRRPQRQIQRRQPGRADVFVHERQRRVAGVDGIELCDVKYSVGDETTEAHDYGGAVNWHLTTGAGVDTNAFQFGAKLRNEHRWYNNFSRKYAPTTDIPVSQVLDALHRSQLLLGARPGLLHGPAAQLEEVHGLRERQSVAVHEQDQCRGRLQQRFLRLGAHSRRLRDEHQAVRRVDVQRRPARGTDARRLHRATYSPPTPTTTRR